MPLTIRPIREADAQGTLDLLRPIVEAECYTAMTGPLDLESQLRWIREIRAQGLCLIAEEDDSPGAILGMQDVMPLVPGADTGDISTFVSLDHHRQGIGRALTQATLDLLPNLGISRLRAVVRADNPAAQSFYKGQGFQVAAGLPDQVILELTLNF